MLKEIKTKFMSVQVRFFCQISSGTKLKKKKASVVQSFLISELKVRVCGPLPNSFLGGAIITFPSLSLLSAI